MLLEELVLTYGLVYIDFAKGEQKAAAHTQYNANGRRIPTLLDHHSGDFVVTVGKATPFSSTSSTRTTRRSDSS